MKFQQASVLQAYVAELFTERKTNMERQSIKDDTGWHFSTDALVWAEQFIAHKNKLGWSLEDIDEGLMLAWFANAMMSMHDHVERKKD